MDINDLKKLQEKENMSYETIAELSGIPLDIVTKIFSGEIKEPKYMSLLAMEQVIVRKKKIPFYYDVEQEQPCLIREQVAYNFDARRYHVDDVRQLCAGVRVEIIDGKYYPISIKHSTPPIKGVWDQDAIDLATNAILIEEEFETEVFVGFIDYTKINERRPVVMDVNIRKALFDIINEVKDIEYNKKVPTVKINDKKCGNCEYKNICLKE